MTCKEKYQLDHPDATKEECDEIFMEECPCDNGYADVPYHCNDAACAVCWDRDFDWRREENAEPVIKDSGDRTEFESGAVRDMRTGKGRCDLMPLEVIGRILEDKESYKPINSIADFMKYNDTFHLYMALDSFAEVAYNDDVHTMLLEVAKHFEEGAKKYGDNNWQKGIPVHCYIDSAVRHYLKWLRGDKDEPHDRAFVWNLMCCIWEVDYHKKETE